MSDVHTSGAQIMTIIKSISKSSETSKEPRVHSVAVVVKFVVAMRGSTGTGNKCDVLTWTFATQKEKKNGGNESRTDTLMDQREAALSTQFYRSPRKENVASANKLF